MNKRHRGQRLEDYVAMGWLALPILAGATESEEIGIDPAIEEVELFGQIFGATGHKLTGRDRPHMGTEETDTGIIVTLSKPAGEDITVLYRLEELDDSDEDEDEDDELAD